jgi:outer membrane murein-binding lipoprotein Lpp
MGVKITGRIVVVIIGAVLIVGLILAGPAACNRIRSLTAQSKVDHAQTGAFTNSASDAVNTASGAATNEAASDATTRSNERNIRDAKGASDKVDPAVRDAGFTSLCKRPSFRDSPTGRLRCTSAS